jgi:hypothetical protein
MDIQIIQLSSQVWSEILKELPHDIYHLPEYVYLEAKRMSTIPEAILISEHEKLFFAPYLLRRYDASLDDLKLQDGFDAISPYGYPGILVSESAKKEPDFLTLAINQLVSTLRDKGVCSAFFRLHPILNEDFHEIYPPDICQITGETVSVNLKLSEEEIWQQTRSDHRKDINRNKRAGFIAKIVPFAQHINEFIEIYEETMDRTGAAKSYYFGSHFFQELLILEKFLHLGMVEIDGCIASACLITECCGIVQTYLGGTRNQFLKQTPDKLLFDYVRFWAKERGNEVFHLGGGVGGAKDGVYNFKAGFSKQRHSFATLRLTIDENKYHYLTELRAKALNKPVETLLQSNFFPAYRASI